MSSIFAPIDYDYEYSYVDFDQFWESIQEYIDAWQFTDRLHFILSVMNVSVRLSISTPTTSS